jgi:hypothetical protein
MRFRRLSFIAGWAALILLAVVGFAAFGTRSLPDAADSGTGRATLGHVTGAYAGVMFAFLSGDGSEAPADHAYSVITGSPASQSPPTTEVSMEVDSSGWLSQIQVRALVSKYFAATDVNQAVRIAWCESRFDPDSVNRRTGGIGLFQHLPKYWPDRVAAAGFPGADPIDPEASTAAAAWEVYQGGGWSVFNCRG